MQVIKFVTENWYLILSFIVLALVIFIIVRDFLKLPNDTKLKNIQEWLLYAVTEAERELGSGTGQIKLRMVYDMFLTNFVDLSQWISFETFSSMVDSSLETFRNLLDTNAKIREYVYGLETIEENTVELGKEVV